MRFNTLAVVPIICYALFPQTVQAQASQDSGWLFGSLIILDTSPPDPTPLCIDANPFCMPGGSVSITSTGPVILPPPVSIPNGMETGAVNASLMASYANPFSIIYASTERSGTLSQRCTYSEDNIPPKTIKSTEGFVWQKSSVSPGYASVSFGGFSPAANEGLIMTGYEFHPYFTAIYVSSYALHYSSTFTLTGAISALSAAYGVGTSLITPQAEAIRGWSCIEGDILSNGTGGM
ncbi:hypothetical protein [Armatimonas sp.]|uniref:hypothetical protein n=1 Tax=Armatimonas sp. TaxID=1872638 RepID=UPI003752EAF3